MFRHGQIVRVKNLQYLKSQRYVFPNCVEEMWAFAGKMVTLDIIMPGESFLKIQDSHFLWHIDWFEYGDFLDNRLVGAE